MIGLLLVIVFFIVAMSIIAAVTICNICDSDYRVHRFRTMFFGKDDNK